MRVKYFLQMILCLAMFTQVYAQDGTDAVKHEKARQEAGKLETKLSTQKEKLGNLETKLKELESRMNDENAQAQRGANQTDKVSDKLSKDPNNKRLNRKAHKASRSSKKQAKAARKHTNRHESLEKDIRKLKGSIEQNEKKLSKISL